MGASTEMSRLDSLPTATLNALLGLDTDSLDDLATAKTALLALAETSTALLALAEQSEALLALAAKKDEILANLPEDTEPVEAT